MWTWCRGGCWRGARTTSHGPVRVRLGRSRNLARPGARRGVRLQTGRTRPRSGVETAIRLVLDSARPPFGPPAPRFSLKDAAVRCAESRTRTALGARYGGAGRATNLRGGDRVSVRTCLGGQVGCVREDMSLGTVEGVGGFVLRDRLGLRRYENVGADAVWVQGRRGAGSPRSGQEAPSAITVVPGDRGGVRPSQARAMVLARCLASIECDLSEGGPPRGHPAAPGYASVKPAPRRHVRRHSRS
jgi:hypothetical protein